MQYENLYSPYSGSVKENNVKRKRNDEKSSLDSLEVRNKLTKSNYGISIHELFMTSAQTFLVPNVFIIPKLCR